MRELRVSYRVKDREIRGLLEREGFDLRRGYSAHAGIEQLIFTQTLS